MRCLYDSKDILCMVLINKMFISGLNFYYGRCFLGSVGTSGGLFAGLFELSSVKTLGVDCVGGGLLLGSLMRVSTESSNTSVSEPMEFRSLKIKSFVASSRKVTEGESSSEFMQDIESSISDAFLFFDFFTFFIAFNISAFGKPGIVHFIRLEIVDSGTWDFVGVIFLRGLQ